MNLDTFTTAYIEAALWSTSAEQPPHTDQSFTDLGYGIEALATETLDRMVADCTVFQESCGALLTEENCPRCPGECTVIEYAGHDFWLTRNGHGAGFWDGDWKEPAASTLDRSAKSFGEVDLYLGDDGKIYA